MNFGAICGVNCWTGCWHPLMWRGGGAWCLVCGEQRGEMVTGGKDFHGGTWCANKNIEHVFVAIGENCRVKESSCVQSWGTTYEITWQCVLHFTVSNRFMGLNVIFLKIPICVPWIGGWKSDPFGWWTVCKKRLWKFKSLFFLAMDRALWYCTKPSFCHKKHAFLVLRGFHC